jgi:uncharacterized membrane protein
MGSVSVCAYVCVCMFQIVCVYVSIQAQDQTEFAQTSLETMINTHLALVDVTQAAHKAELNSMQAKATTVDR